MVDTVFEANRAIFFVPKEGTFNFTCIVQEMNMQSMLVGGSEAATGMGQTNRAIF